MTPEQLLKNARADGVVFVLKGGAVSIRADAQKRTQWADLLRPHKAQITLLLQQEQAQQNHPAIVETEQASTAEPSPNAMTKQTATTWRAVRDAYHDHHHACPVCISAGKGYGLRCGAGASLWAAYSATPWPGYRRR